MFQVVFKGRGVRDPSYNRIEDDLLSAKIALYRKWIADTEINAYIHFQWQGMRISQTDYEYYAHEYQVRFMFEEDMTAFKLKFDLC